MNKDIPKKDLAQIKLLVLDSDGVIVKKGSTIIEKQRGNKQYIYAKNNIIHPRIANKIITLKEKGLLVAVSSGRSLVYLQGMYERIAGKGTILMAENGNVILKDNRIYQT